jgi:hypothetical protein
MPQIFKALTTIMAWVLWISALVMGFSVLIMGIIRGELYGSAPVPMSDWAGFAIALAFAIGSVVVMKIRKTLE